MMEKGTIFRNTLCRDEHGAWDCGGGLEFGDTVEEALQKEIHEEYKTSILKTVGTFPPFFY
jgi:ADP-ribose pyrophosphatase YjhB (NUDIX family)